MMLHLPLDQIIWFVFTGVAAACGFLYYIRKMGTSKKHRLFAIGLFLIALIYVLFSLPTFNKFWIILEIAGLLLFVLFIWMAYHYSMWFVAIGWAAHIIWDMGIQPQETAPYVPYWYAWICVGFDAVIAVFMAYSLAKHDHVTS